MFQFRVRVLFVFYFVFDLDLGFDVCVDSGFVLTLGLRSFSTLSSC